MNVDQWEKIKNILKEVLDQPEGVRDKLLQQACGKDTLLRREVDAYLKANPQNVAFLSQGVPEAREPRGELMEGDFIGPYRIEHEIGRGGMGVVYLGIRDDREFTQKVAIKVVKRGMDRDDIVRRFRNERQILAHLNHANIARLLEGGTTEDGRPYFVMEYVQGKGILDYCDHHQCSIRARLLLFEKIGAAVQFAHRNLVVHRDLKPGNILVTQEGEPKLLEFGSAVYPY